MKLVLVTPRVSEKAYRLVTNENTYIFDVPMSANKNSFFCGLKPRIYLFCKIGRAHV